MDLSALILKPCFPGISKMMSEFFLQEKLKIISGEGS